MDFVWFSGQAAIISLNSVNQLIFVMVECSVYFAARTEFLNIIYGSFSFRGLNLQLFVFLRPCLEVSSIMDTARLLGSPYPGPYTWPATRWADSGRTGLETFTEVVTYLIFAWQAAKTVLCNKTVLLFVLISLPNRLFTDPNTVFAL
jgi:hypothetical protein